MDPGRGDRGGQHDDRPDRLCAARMPERGETVIGDRFAQGFGGKGANQAVMARLMGAQVAMVNAVGDDSYGDQTLATATASTRRTCDECPARAAWHPSGWSRTAATASSSCPARTPGCLSTAPRRWRPRTVSTPSSLSSRFSAGRHGGRLPGGPPARCDDRLNPAPGRPSIRTCLGVSDWIDPQRDGVRHHRASRGPAGTTCLTRARWHAWPRASGTRLLVTLGERGAALVGEAR